MHMAKRPLFYLLVIFLLSACAVSQDEIPIPSEPIGAMSVVTTSESIYADGNTSATVRVILSLENDDPYPDYPINFNTSLGSLSKTQVVTDEFGIAEVTLTSITLGTAKVTIIAGSYTETITINVIASETQAATPSYVSLATEKPIILTNNTETTEITATMLDVNYGVVPGVQVSFAATGGQLSATQVVTDEKGEAVVTFSSGALDASNRVETITVKAGSLSKQIPVQITGTEIQLVSVDKSLILGGTSAQATTTLNLAATDASSKPIYNESISLSVSGTGSGPGAANLSSTTLTTDYYGKASATISATAAGTVRVTANGLGSTRTLDVNISELADAFYISAPTSNPRFADIGDNVIVTVNAPTQANVFFITSLGTITDGGSTDVQLTIPVVAGVASVTLNSTIGGVATVEAYDAVDLNVVDSIQVSFASPASAANTVEIQSSKTVLPISNGDTIYETTLTATVFDINGFPVQDAPVWFDISNSTGGGESVAPAYGLTSSNGQFQTIFRSGSISSSPEGVIITANINGGAQDTLPVVIGGTPGSLIIGRATVVSEINESTAYKLPMSVLVADSNGNPMVGTSVSLSAWPMGYYTGYWDELLADGSRTCSVVYTSTTHTVLGVETVSDPGIIPNEDDNRDLIYSVAEDDNSDGQLTPPNSAAGTLPLSVVTDDNGVATFDLVYLKQYSIWLVAGISATTRVVGTETTSTLVFTLPALITDMDDCRLPESPFGRDDLWRIPHT